MDKVVLGQGCGRLAGRGHDGARAPAAKREQRPSRGHPAPSHLIAA